VQRAYTLNALFVVLATWAAWRWFEERSGRRLAAIRAYQTALRYAPDYEPSRRELLRPGAAATPEASRTPNERLAAALVERAHAAALRGDYAGALTQLDEAERIAPRFARIFHYRANVAYLMGDRAAARTALRRAIELEPENPLYRTNLERLEQPAAEAAQPASQAPDAPKAP
jgi:tetratricopeptide (TPR) repeat protein